MTPRPLTLTPKLQTLNQADPDLPPPQREFPPRGKVGGKAPPLCSPFRDDSVSWQKCSVVFVANTCLGEISFGRASPGGGRRSIFVSKIVPGYTPVSPACRVFTLSVIPRPQITEYPFGFTSPTDIVQMDGFLKLLHVT